MKYEFSKYSITIEAESYQEAEKILQAEIEAGNVQVSTTYVEPVEESPVKVEETKPEEPVKSKK